MSQVVGGNSISNKNLHLFSVACLLLVLLISMSNSIFFPVLPLVAERALTAPVRRANV